MDKLGQLVGCNDNSLALEKAEEVIKATYRKHMCDDADIGWRELSIMMVHALNEIIGVNKTQEFLDSLGDYDC